MIQDIIIKGLRLSPSSNCTEPSSKKRKNFIHKLILTNVQRTYSQKSPTFHDHDIVPASPDARIAFFSWQLGGNFGPQNLQASPALAPRARAKLRGPQPDSTLTTSDQISENTLLITAI
jgi:hypothetical protein